MNKYVIIKKKDKAIISVMRTSDGEVFSVGDTIHIKRYAYSRKEWRKRKWCTLHNSVMVDVKIKISNISEFPYENGKDVALTCGKFSTSLYDEANRGHVKQLSQEFLEQEERARVEFAKKLEQLIPDVERMVETEKNHLNYLKKNQLKYGSFISDNDIESMIKKSERMLAHYEQRLEEYKKYVETTMHNETV